MSFNPLFSIEFGFYIFIFLIGVGLFSMLVDLYLTVCFYFKAVSRVSVHRLNGKYYTGDSRIYFDKLSIFESTKNKNVMDRKIDRYINSNKYIECKKIPGFGYYIKMSGLKSGAFIFCILMSLLAVFTYKHSNYFYYYGGVMLPEIQSVFVFKSS